MSQNGPRLLCKGLSLPASSLVWITETAQSRPQRPLQKFGRRHRTVCERPLLLTMRDDALHRPGPASLCFSIYRLRPVSGCFLESWLGQSLGEQIFPNQNGISV